MADGRARVSSSDDDEVSSNDSSSGTPHSYVAGLMASTHDEYTRMTRNSSQLDLTGAYISEDEEPGTPGDNPTESASAWNGTPEAPSIGLPQQTVDDVSHFSIDIGGSLIKLVYFSSDRSTPNAPITHGGRLHFKKWETKHYRECINYIKRKRLHLSASGKQVAVKATGGGAFKFQEEFREQLGIELQKQDEMRSLVAGSDFFLRAIEDEVFTFQAGVRHYVQDQPIYPYLLVNIGSGVSIVKVEAEGVYERISGTNIGGGTFWGLCRLLTGVKSFDEMLKLSAQGDNTAVDMLVGDIYGGNDYSSVGLAATTIASSFGKVVMDDSFSPSDYKPEDIALSLLRMISYNIAQVAVLNAMKFKLQRLMFGGFFIRGHPYTMETISYAIKFWSKGEHQAMFMRHEGFLGAMGAFLLSDTAVSKALTRAVSEAKGSWVEKFIRSARNNGSHSTTSTHSPGSGSGERFHLSSTPPRTSTLGCSPRHGRALIRESVSGTFDLGVLHLMPSLQCFPLLAQPTKYTADTFNLTSKEDRQYWIQSFRRHQPSLVGKALASSGAGAADDVSEEHRKACEARAAAFDTAFCEHLDKLQKDPSAFGRSSLNAIFEFREECLRVNGFPDAYAPDKAKENAAALEALPDLLEELDSMAPDDRLLALVEGTLAGNIFDWGSNACVELYQNDTILEMYRKARAELRRPWIVDDFEAVKLKLNEMQPNGGGYKKAVILLDNSGADAVLGMIPLARELARRGARVVLAANSLPALNDITNAELKQVMELAAQVDPVLQVIGNGSGSPCINLRLVSEQLATAAVGCDLLIIEGMGRAVHTNLHATFTADCLKLAMIKNQRVAEQLFQGNIYDCMCKFQPGRPASSTSSVSSQKGC